MVILLLGLTICVGFVNGGNDVSKGVATLVGSGVGSYRRAVVWGSGWTVVGAIAAAYVSRGFVPVFSGRGILLSPPAGVTFPIAVASGVMGWLLFATRSGLPVSTTHALVGGLVGAGTAASGPAGVDWARVVRTVGLPLGASPLLAFAFLVAILPTVRLLFRRLNGYCVCLERRPVLLGSAAAEANLAMGSLPQVITGTECPPEVMGRVETLDALHWLSAGLTNFARALNDAPKILALGLAAQEGLSLPPGVTVAGVAAAMGAGSLLAGAKVTETLGTKVTRISAADGLAANLTTSALVALASALAAPVSTTHVASGAIIGVGIHGAGVQWNLVRGMLLAWLVTLPIAAVLAGIAFALLTR